MDRVWGAPGNPLVFQVAVEQLRVELVDGVQKLRGSPLRPKRPQHAFFVRDPLRKGSSFQRVWVFGKVYVAGLVDFLSPNEQFPGGDRSDHQGGWLAAPLNLGCDASLDQSRQQTIQVRRRNAAMAARMVTKFLAEFGPRAMNPACRGRREPCKYFVEEFE